MIEQPTQQALDRARHFVDQNGTPLDLLFLETALEMRPPVELAATLEASQDEEGGFGALSGAPDGSPPGGEEGRLARTARGLRLLDAAGLKEHPVTERAVAFLCAARSPDGSWSEATDRTEDERLVRTGEVVALLGRSPFAPASVLNAAEGWLREGWSVERVKGPAYGPILAYFAALASIPSELADEALQWCGRELERGYRSGAFGPVATARVFLRCGASALPGAGIRASEVVASLLDAQQEDGGYPAATLDERVVETLDAAIALARLGD